MKGRSSLNWGWTITVFPKPPPLGGLGFAFYFFTFYSWLRHLEVSLGITRISMGRRKKWKRNLQIRKNLMHLLKSTLSLHYLTCLDSKLLPRKLYLQKNLLHRVKNLRPQRKNQLQNGKTPWTKSQYILVLTKRIRSYAVNRLQNISISA